MGRYGFIPHGYEERGEYLVNIETNKVWNTDKTVAELTGKEVKHEPEAVKLDSPAADSVPETVEIPKVQAKKVTKAIKRG